MTIPAERTANGGIELPGQSGGSIVFWRPSETGGNYLVEMRDASGESLGVTELMKVQVQQIAPCLLR